MAVPAETSTSTPTSTPPPRRDTRNNTDCRSVSPDRSCCKCGGVIAPAGRNVIPNRHGGDGYGGGSSVELECERENHDCSCCQPPTPTTDILRRLLYENSPISASLNTERSGGKHRRGAADDDGGGYFENAGRKSRHGRRLFAECSTALRARPVDSDGVAGLRRSPGTLFSDLACEAGAVKATVDDRCETRGCSRLLAVREGGGDGNGKTVISGGLKAAAEKPGSDALMGRLAASEVVLRERLLQARKEFSVLRAVAPID